MRQLSGSELELKQRTGAAALWILALSLLCSTGARAFIPEESAVLERKEILKSVEAARSKSAEEAEAISEQRSAQRNARIAEELSGPPSNYEHFNRPQNPYAQRQARQRIQETGSGAAGETGSPDTADKPKLFSPLSSIIGLILFAAALAIHSALSRQRQAKQKPVGPSTF